jgi:glycosyltransferase involved in cell wall biosynthesis
VEVHSCGGLRLLERGRLQAATRGIHDAAVERRLAALIAEIDTPGTVYHLHGWAQIFSPAVFRALAPVAARSFLHAHDMFLACPNGVYMDYRRGEVCTRRPLSAACISTNCDKRSYAQKLWRVARQTAVRRWLDPALPWAGIVQIHPDMQPRLARAGFPDSMFRTLRNPAVPYTQSRIRAEENRRLVYVGRLEADKGVRGLVAAAARLDLPLTLVGDGPLREELAAAHPGVEITGWLGSGEIGRHVGRARALVMPSEHPEPFALVLAEAVHSGLPVAVSNTALMAEEIAAAGLGLSFDAGDPGDTDRVLAAFRDMPPDRLRAMSEAGHTGPHRLALSPEAWGDGLLALYRGAVARSARAA